MSTKLVPTAKLGEVQTFVYFQIAPAMDLSYVVGTHPCSARPSLYNTHFQTVIDTTVGAKGCFLYCTLIIPVQSRHQQLFVHNPMEEDLMGAFL